LVAWALALRDLFADLLQKFSGVGVCGYFFCDLFEDFFHGAAEFVTAFDERNTILLCSEHLDAQSLPKAQVTSRKSSENCLKSQELREMGG
jgi:hypothetical protein